MMKRRTDSGVALITAILMMALMSALLVGATALVISEQKSRFQDRDRTQAFEAAHSGLEKLTNDLGDLFTKTYAPTSSQISSLTTNPPTMTGISFTAPGGTAGSGYTITQGATQTRTLSSGTYIGLTALVTPYTIDVTAKTTTQSEVALERTLNTVAIPVFQFGIFSETDLSFFPGPNFNFGGRVHTNGNLFLAKGGNGSPANATELILGDRVTALGAVVRSQLSNGLPITSNYLNNVRIITTPGGCGTPQAPTATATTCRIIASNEGSVSGGVGSSATSNWSTISLGASPTWYNSMLKNGQTGVTRLNLPLAGAGAKPIDLIARPKVGEDVTGPIFTQRYFQYAALRILISDTAADITSLPTVTSTAPVDLSAIAANTYGAGRPARASTGGTPSVTGFLKIEKQNAAGTAWTDITSTILNMGYVGHSIKAGCTADPDTGAIIRFQRPKRSLAGCTTTTSGDNYGPHVLYDAREGALRDDSSLVNPHWEGVMQYVELDIKNLRAWLVAQTDIMNTTGYVVYFSDRRGSHDAAGNSTGELGFEDVVNPANANGATNGTLDAGEDVNGNGVVDVVGKQNRAMAASPLITDDVTATTAETTATPFFRRALKLVNGNRTNMLAGQPGGSLGLTVAAENPIYIQGDYNATTSEDSGSTSTWNESYDQPHIATAVIGDAVTLLSNQWNDANSLDSPYNTGGRLVTAETSYRTAIISGKGMSFPQPSFSGVAADFGTDGGTHNFLRYLENWQGNNLYYRGSMVSFFYSVEATGTFKCCTVVYNPPARLYSFDDEFLTPALLPPRTPMVRDLNTTSFNKLPGPTSP